MSLFIDFLNLFYSYFIDLFTKMFYKNYQRIINTTDENDKNTTDKNKKKALEMLNEWKVKTYADNKFLIKIPIKKEKEMLTLFLKELK